MNRSLLRSVRGYREHPLNSRQNRSISKDNSSTQIDLKNILKYSPGFSSSVKDPAVKGRRYDYLIFFNKKISLKLDSTSKTPCKKKLSPYPARYCPIDNHSINEKKKPFKHVNDDLKLISDINFDADFNILRRDKLCRNYTLIDPAPIDIDKSIHRTDKKKVRFSAEF